MDYKLKKIGKIKFIEEGKGEDLVLLHGLFGALSNFRDLIDHFKETHRVFIPMLPLYELTNLDTTVSGLAKFVEKFVEARGLKQFHILGNSLGHFIGKFIEYFGGGMVMTKD